MGTAFTIKNKTIKYPICPNCDRQIDSYSEKELLRLVSDESQKAIVICPNCERKVSITCTIEFDGWVMGK